MLPEPGGERGKSFVSLRKLTLLFSSISWYMKIMSEAISRTRKKRGRGRPPTGAESVHLRVLPDQWAKIDAWMKAQNDLELTRPEAIRRLLELALKFREAAEQSRSKARAR
jgi:hypothetical protein